MHDADVPDDGPVISVSLTHRLAHWPVIF